MKKLISISLFVSLLTIGTAWAQQNVNFDENGNGTFNNGGTITTLTWGTGAMANDPGITTLYYNLPFLAVDGDLRIIEPSDGTISDVLRFIPDTTGLFSRVYVYSDHEPGAPDGDIADTAIPQPWAKVVQVPEIGTEGNWNGVIWQPTSYDPGGVSASMTYNFTSDVPEPATISLLGLGALTLIRRRRSAA